LKLKICVKPGGSREIRRIYGGDIKEYEKILDAAEK
jgi:uncharacterized protein YbjQ (UPF0145 family)